jgi:hypothetical protein
MSPRRNWDSPTPLAASECALPRGPKGGGAHSPAAKGVGESQFRRLEKKLSTLPTLWFVLLFFFCLWLLWLDSLNARPIPYAYFLTQQQFLYCHVVVIESNTDGS